MESRQEGFSRREGASEFWKEWALVLEGVQTLGIQCTVLFSPGQLPPAATSTAPPASPSPAQPPALRLSTTLSGNSQRAEVRWRDKQEVQWNFIPGKKKKKDLGMSYRIEGSGC